jgi:hypothetical protein
VSWPVLLLLASSSGFGADVVAANPAVTLSLAVPRDALAVLLINPPAGAAAPNLFPAAAQTLAGVAGRLRDMGALPRDGALIWLDALQALSGTLHRPCAWVLHDLRLEPLEWGSSRLSALGASVIIADGGDHAATAEQIRHFLRHYTTQASARVESWDLEGRTFHRLVDQRLPPWAVFEWGPLGDRYVVSIGRGISAKAVQAADSPAAGLLGDAQVARAWSRLRAEEAGGWLYVDVRSLRAALAGSGPRADAVCSALGLDLSGRALFTAARDGRAVILRQARLLEDGEQFADLSRPAGSLAPYIPQGAGWYVMLDVPPAQVLRRLRDTYVGWHRPEVRQRLTEAWEALARDKDIDFERDVLAELGQHTIIYDWPRHPMAIPGMVTVLLHISGDAQRLSESLRKIFEYVAPRLDAAAGPDPSFFAPHLRRSADGLWYVQAGFLGPAVAVTRDYVIISYSLPALEQNLLLSGEPSPPQGEKERGSQPDSERGGS